MIIISCNSLTIPGRNLSSSIQSAQQPYEWAKCLFNYFPLFSFFLPHLFIDNTVGYPLIQQIEDFVDFPCLIHQTHFFHLYVLPLLDPLTS